MNAKANFTFKSVFEKLAYLFIGFLLIAFGITISVKSNLGLSPWDVFHQGLSIVFNVNIGLMGIYVGIGVIFIASLIKVFPGVGTILNTIFIGIFIDIMMPYIPSYDNIVIALLMNLLGVISMSLGTVLYLKANAGAGPRDSLLLGLMQKFNLDTKYVKPVMEAIVLISGIILGGTFGIGTFFSLLLMGYFMDLFFKMFNYDPKQKKQMNILEQVKYLRGVKAYEGSRG